jgi:hypothetical protein
MMGVLLEKGFWSSGSWNDAILTFAFDVNKWHLTLWCIFLLGIAREKGCYFGEFFWS